LKFLIPAYTGLGNFVLKTPLIRSIHQNFPDSKIDIVYGNNWGAEGVLGDSDWVRVSHRCSITSSLLYKLLFLYSLRKERYDVVLMPFDSTPIFFQIACGLLSAKVIVMHFSVNNSSLARRALALFNAFFYPNRHLISILPGRHEIDLNLDLLEPLMSVPTKRDLRTFVHCRTENISCFNLRKPYIVIQPSAMNGGLTPKTWAPENFIMLIRKLREHALFENFVLVGDEGDIEGFPADNFMESDIVNLVGKTSLNQLYNVLSGADLVLSHDSGVMHVTNALNRPLLALYGPTDFTRTRPLGSKSHILHSRNECWAKMYAFRSSEAELAEQFQNYYCMSGISVDMVCLEIESILDDEK